MTRTYRAYNSAASTATVPVESVRPEFQLIEVTNPKGFVAQSGIFVAPGTIYGRLFFAAGCEPVGGTFKGKILFDSRKSNGNNGWQSRGKGYEIHFICPDANEYSRLSGLCVPSNMPINRVRTLKLLKEVTANNVVNIQSRQQPATTTTPVVVTCETDKVAIPLHKVAAPAVTVISKPVVETPPVVEVQATAPIVVVREACRRQAPVVEVPIVVEVPQPVVETASSPYAFMAKYKPFTLRSRICKRWGIICAQVEDKDMFAYTVTQLQKRNITPQMIKSIFRQGK